MRDILVRITCDRCGHYEVHRSAADADASPGWQQRTDDAPRRADLCPQCLAGPLILEPDRRRVARLLADLAAQTPCPIVP